MLTLETRTAVLTRLGRALADPTRSRILVALADGPAYPAQLAAELGLSRSNVSNHLTCLRGCGLVVGTPEGRQVRYELVDGHLTHALADLLEVVIAVDCESA
ncbi:Cd(II)/Pb(II)-sensing metalloregulatory transcriptional regulator CmtR [Motilibacter aurantiacus]|uniref:Cd(II)/Pb(II)-sensing metalloregulatory transcriptional regulator CmtR n=1 Tax=Motilibacter aurantiacus TaxID=2714955 RepID=UPI00140C1AAD|nr:winged helix-turn-helix transcriptional regulator [Motilibacter aurantiacus]